VAARHSLRHAQRQRQWRLGLVDSLAQERRIAGMCGARKDAGSRFPEAIGNDAKVIVDRPMYSRSFLFGKLVPHHRLVQRKLNIKNLVELHFACPVAVESVGTLECEAARPADMVHRAG